MQTRTQPQATQHLHAPSKKISSLSVRVMFIFGCLTAFTGGNGFAAIYPPETIYNGSKSVPSLSRPGYLQTVTDPVFGTKITRISDESMNLGHYTYMQHNYSKDQPWNRDMSLIKLNGAVAILDAKTYQVFKRTSWHEESRWSTIDPDIMYYVSGNQFRRWNVRTNADTALHTFSEGSIRMGDGEGSPSIGDKYVVLNAGSLVIVYDIEIDTIISKKDLGPLNFVSISQSGNYVVFMPEGAGPGGIRVYDRNLNLLRTVFNTNGDMAGHGDPGYDAAGNEIWAQVCVPMAMARLDNGQTTNLPPGSCGHLSTRNYNRPGWAYLSQGGEVFAKKLDGSAIVQRFAHHRSTEQSYDAQAKATVSPDGSKVMWNSDWGSGSVYAYVAEMPGNSGTPDTTAPPTPTGLTITDISQPQINLSSNDFTDNIGGIGYWTFCGSAPIETVRSASYSNTDLSAGAQNTYSIAAYDAALEGADARGADGYSGGGRRYHPGRTADSQVLRQWRIKTSVRGSSYRDGSISHKANVMMARALQ